MPQVHSLLWAVLHGTPVWCTNRIPTNHYRTGRLPSVAHVPAREAAIAKRAAQELVEQRLEQFVQADATHRRLKSLWNMPRRVISKR